MNLRPIFYQFNIRSQCKKYNVPLRQCPNFLFMIMGTAIGVFALVAYYGATTKAAVDSELAALGVLFMSMVLLIVTFAIVQGFEKVAEASRLKSEFISIVSHQLRTPITNLRWSIDMLNSGKLDHATDKQHDYFKIIGDNTARMNELVQDLLMVSRLEQGRLPTRIQEAYLPDFIREVLIRFHQIAQGAGVETSFNVNSDIPKISTDPSHLKIILENFIQNAVRYSKAGGKVEVLLRRRNDNLLVRVLDQGIGIGLHDQKFIFQKFFRTDMARTHQPAGTGLGLYISRMLVENLGGKTGFSSQENKGSTFWFTLPIKNPS